ncbi:hypothetical protein PybrP1_006824 [[Pythium] brassicae (nom. inval.)]|nr:hypothetical protein PybrP1_006824 [[Pythium] brassicae (nom. inval.)]
MDAAAEVVVSQRLAPSTSPTKDAVLAKAPASVVNFDASSSPAKSAVLQFSTVRVTSPSSFVQHPVGFSVGGGHVMATVDPALKEDGEIEPKVFVPYARTEHLPPRKVEVERKKRLYESANVGELLKKRLESIQQTSMFTKVSEDASGTARAVIDSLGLHLFDDESYEIHSPEDWIQLGRRQDGSVRIPITALYTVRGLSSFWCDAHVIGYRADTQTYAVQFQRNKKAEVAEARRLDICFKAEDPDNFADRYVSAHVARLQAQNLLRKNLYVDCMPVEGLHKLGNESLNKIARLATAVFHGKNHRIPDTTRILHEIQLNYLRTMNKVIFEFHQLANRNVEVFSTFLSPDEEAPRGPCERVVVRSSAGQKIEAPPIDYADQFIGFSFQTFLTSPEALAALLKVNEECYRVLQLELFNVKTGRSTKLEEFQQRQQALERVVLKTITEEWPNKVATTIKASLANVGKGWYYLQESRQDTYEFSKLRSLLRRINFTMKDTLRYLTDHSLHQFRDFIKRSVVGAVHIVDAKTAFIAYPDLDRATLGDIKWQYLCMERQQLAPTSLFVVSVVVSIDVHVINQRDVDAAADRIAKWKPKDPDDASDVCPLRPVEPRKGHVFTFNTNVATFRGTVVELFLKMLESLKHIKQVEQVVMNKLFWSAHPCLPSVSANEDWVVALKRDLEALMERAELPLRAYLLQYDSYISFVNLSEDEYVAEFQAQKPPNLALLQDAIKKHFQDALVVEETLPAVNVELGMYSVSCVSIRTLLAEKHRRLAKKLLDLQLQNSTTLAKELLEKFEAINRQLQKIPQNIEELTELHAYLESVGAQLAPLLAQSQQLIKYRVVLDTFQYHYERDDFVTIWRVRLCPNTIQEQSKRMHHILQMQKAQFATEMHDQQSEFTESLRVLHNEVDSFRQYTDIARLDQVHKYVTAIEQKIFKADEDAKLFNSREALFAHEVTDYDEIQKIRRDFEPYAVLWKTAHGWLKEHKKWMDGAFLDANGEEIETFVEASWGAIQKALKQFEKLGVKGCTDIATLIKDEIAGFRPRVPLVLALRNPGMQERHWNQMNQEIAMTFRPDRGMKLSYVLELGLETHLETIARICETAGKEYQIEKTLNAMEEQWKAVSLTIVDYRETETYVLKSVDEIQALLDEQITTTQAMQFSAFKRPFEERISRWERTLSTVSDVLDEWIQVQRSWLYLQPIFDSPDINKQLPTEGKRFATVDKNWRQTLSAAKQKPSAITFCNNDKLLDRFQESNRFLEQVQKGLSDFLETKRSAFSRFYFLSNEELLSILSESKDVKLVQPHLKKCFEGVVAVEFQDDLSITAMVSAEGEKVALTRPVNPVGKNVEHWMTEVEEMMRVSVRDVMLLSIQDYAKVARTKWIQKWPGMCVLNGSQFHWTREMEEHMAASGSAGVKTMMDRQLAQLADMVEMVRGPLDKLARISVGALTVIDVHARDVTARLVHSHVSTKEDFMWSSQLRYYWEDDLFADMLNLGALIRVIKRTIEKQKLQVHPFFLMKVVQLYETLCVRHGLMVVGATGGGKSANLSVLADALTELKSLNEVGHAYERVAVGPQHLLVLTSTLYHLFDLYLRPSLHFVASYVKEWLPQVPSNLAQSLMRLLDCFLAPLKKEEKKDAKAEHMAFFLRNIESVFVFCLIWSVGATGNDAGRARFDAFVRHELVGNSATKLPPAAGLVYDYAFDVAKEAWVPWLDTISKFAVDPAASFAEIVVPTSDSVRSAFLMNLALPLGVHMLIVGPTGTGKTVDVNQFLEKADPDKFVPLKMAFSAQTSANQTQDFIDSKMEKRRKGVFGPAAGKKFVIYVDDLNMPKQEEYFAQPPIEILRQWFDQNGWYDRKLLQFRTIIDVVFVCAMGPPGGGRNPITPRFVRHFNIVGYTEMSDASKSVVFDTILGGFFQRFADEIKPLGVARRFVQSSICIYNTVIAELLPTPAKVHYTFNLRDLAKVFQGVLMGDAKRIARLEQMVRLWVHENMRVFEDRFTTPADHTWFQDLLRTQAATVFGELLGVPGAASGDVAATHAVWARVHPASHLFYGDYMVPGADPKVYEEVADVDKLQAQVEEYLNDYNAESSAPMNLVMFMNAIEHVSRIARVIRQPQGNALLLGVGGSGRQSLTRLAAYMAEYLCTQIEITKGYGVTEWRDDLKKCLMQAGIDEKPVVFLFSDVQIVHETMLEDINSVLNSGDVPNLYAPEDLDQIGAHCRAYCVKKKLPPTKLNTFAQYLLIVRQNLHLVLCMSPLGGVFRDRLRMFPSLVNCCTIDWFSEWPAEALQSVAASAISAADFQLSGDGVAPGAVVAIFQTIHQSVERASAQFYDQLRRYNYVTPTSYLELLYTFKTVLLLKREEVQSKRSRLQNGVDKIAATKAQVAGMQAQLVALKPQLERTQLEVDAMMQQIVRDKRDADETKAVVEKEEQIANKKAADTQAIADDAQRDLDEALPALEAAVQCLNRLKKSDIDEVKALKNPPHGVKLTMEAACIIFGIKPALKTDPDKAGQKVKDYWESAQKTILGNAKKLMEDMLRFDKDNIGDKIIQQLDPYIELDEFAPAAVRKASVACEAICMWVRAMHTYHNVAKMVEPKKLVLATAQAELDVTLRVLADAKARLQAVVDRLAELEKSYNGAVDKKDELVRDVRQCELRLESALKLIGLLGGEETRWAATIRQLSQDFTNLIGDVVISAGTISYLGTFTSEFRERCVAAWYAGLASFGIPHTPGCNIDTSENGLDVIKLTDKGFLKTLENGIRFGKWVLLENVGEALDATLEPVLLQSKFKQGGQVMMKLGDATVPYNAAFRFFLTTKLPNPHYPPETSVKVTLLNFTITPTGLEDQALGVVVQEEMPELAEKKNSLVVSNARMKAELVEIENKILYMLANSKGNILDDTELIETLGKAKVTSEDINEKMAEAETTERAIDESRERYRGVAFRASLLFFCIADLALVDPMYQYSLPWFVGLFVKSIRAAAESDQLEARLASLNDSATYALYRNVCRSLFEEHKLLFAFLLTIKLLQGANKIDMLEWRFLISGSTPSAVEAPNPDPNWIEDRAWREVCALSTLPAFETFAGSLRSNTPMWRKIFDAADPQLERLPSALDHTLNSFQKLGVLRCLRPDRMTEAIQNFVVEHIGRRFIEPPPFDLASSYADATVVTPIIFVLSTGSDPAKELLVFAETMKMNRKLASISLGQGQGAIAAKMIDDAVTSGKWVLLQNCHLAISWMPQLERICDELNPDATHRDFRLWLTSRPSSAFPTSVLQNGVKMTKEPPKGIRANLRNSYMKLSNESLDATAKPEQFRKLLFGLSFFHALVIERKRFGPLGWNIPYAFNDTDYDISRAQLEMFLDFYDDVPYKVLCVMTSVVNYGGRVTDDKDMRTIDVILEGFFNRQILNDDYAFSPSGLYYAPRVVGADNALQSYLDYIDALPLNPEPEVFGMHDNANITCAMAETFGMFDLVLALQPRVAADGGPSRESIIEQQAKAIADRLPALFEVEAIGIRYPVLYEESMNTVLVQEVQRYNALLHVLHVSLPSLQKALKGLVVMSPELETMANCLFNQKVPPLWEKKAYPSLKPLSAWVEDLLERARFLANWVAHGTPVVFWLSGFFFPQGFLTGILQNHARQCNLAIDTLSFAFLMHPEPPDEVQTKPEAGGCYMTGLFIEGARWDKLAYSLVDPLPKELFSKMPVVHLLPTKDRQAPQSGIYRCPVYKILTRTGTLSTTGHSTNFVFWIEVPSARATVFRSALVSETNLQLQFADQDYWIKAGVACFLSLRY